MRTVTVMMLLGLVGLAGCASNRTPERSFETRAEAEAADLFDADGVPASLVPASAHQIRERRDLRTGEAWIRFEFDASDRAVLLAACAPDPALRLPGAVTRGIGWWPALLRDDAGLASEQFVLATCPSERPGLTTHVAIHRSLGTAFYWRQRTR